MQANETKKHKRSAVVAVMGHVDHGKTSLLDYIRNTRIAIREAGGITQSIGAYEVEHSGQKITFIDTPGHEAFKAMRTRGANIADIGILVVAGDEGIKPQTEESVKIFIESKTPFIVVITKTDLPHSNIQKIQNDLMNIGVFLEGYGGDVSWQGISSKTGEGILELLDLILLLADTMDLTYAYEERASGFILEAKKDNRRGIMVSLILKNGILKTGQNIISSPACGKIKILEDFSGKIVTELSPSAPALVIGFSAMPVVGEEFQASDENLLLTPTKECAPALQELEGIIPAVLKADVSGSLEALKDILSHKIKPVGLSTGSIMDGDIKLAIATNAIIIAFRSSFNNKSVEIFAKSNGIKTFSSEIIYELVKLTEAHIEEVSEPEIEGKMTVLAIFGKKDNKQIVGGKIIEGSIKMGKKIMIKRKGMIIDDAKIINLQKGKLDVKEVSKEEECGMLIDAVASIKIGDEFSQTTAK